MTTRTRHRAVHRSFLVFFALCGVPISTFAQATSSAPDELSVKDAAQEHSASGVEEVKSVDLTRVTTHQLDNELRILLQAIPGAPTVSVCTAIDAGSRRDPVEAPGAHRVLAEMLRWGGYRSDDQDYAALVAQRGGVCDVEVTREATIYCTTVPAAELPLALWVTAGRFTDVALTEREMRAAIEHLAPIAEEEDTEVLAGRAPTRLRKMAFLGSYPYAHPSLPNPDDLDALTLDQLRELHHHEYVARRAVVAISGGATQSDAVDQFPRQLYAARPGTIAPAVASFLVPQTTMRFSMAEDQSSKTPAAWYGWVAPSGEDRLAMNTTLSVLLGKQRLEKTLIGGTRAAKNLKLHLDQPHDPQSHGFSRLEMVGSNSRSLGVIEKQFDTQLRDLYTRGPSEEELVMAQKQLLDEAASRLDTPLGRARELASGVLFGKTVEQVLAPLEPTEETFAVTADRVKHAAASLLIDHRRVTVEVYPKGWQDPWQTPMPRFHIVQKGQTLGSIARSYGTSVAVVTKMNGIDAKRPIYPGDKLKVPRGSAKKERKLRTHMVRRGDTLSGLALKYGVSVRDIADANGMGSKLTIRTGETLRIPWPDKGGSSKSGGSSSSSSSAGGPEMTTHKVTAGQTLSGIAHQHGVSTVALARANGISHKAMVRIGQELKVPPRGTGKPSVAKVVTYKVKKGDTLSGIAQRHGVSVAALTVANKMSRKATLRPGQELNIPQKE